MATDARAQFVGYSDYYSFGDRVTPERGCCVLVWLALHARVISTPHPCY